MLKIEDIKKLIPHEDVLIDEKGKERLYCGRSPKDMVFVYNKVTDASTCWYPSSYKNWTIKKKLKTIKYEASETECGSLIFERVGSDNHETTIRESHAFIRRPGLDLETTEER